MKINKRQGFAPILLIILAAVLAVGGIGIGLAWKTNVLDKWLPANVKEFLGKEITPTNGEQPATDGEEPTGEDQQPNVEDQTKDWKSYMGSGFKIKYPPTWYATQDGEAVWISSYPFSKSGNSLLAQVPSGEVLARLTVDDPAEPTSDADFRDYLKEQYPALEGYTVEEGITNLGPFEWIVVNNGYGSMQTLAQDKVLATLIQGPTREEARDRWEILDLVFSTFSSDQ
uniref:Uncharacterized protein n=1 Tax=candidate division WWE3 bacterium TaxID=2053526 RepID=A0A832E0I1_UNCKA